MIVARVLLVQVMRTTKIELGEDPSQLFCTLDSHNLGWSSLFQALKIMVGHYTNSKLFVVSISLYCHLVSVKVWLLLDSVVILRTNVFFVGDCNSESYMLWIVNIAY